MSKTTSSIKISFSVEFGTEPITHFLLNITGTISETEMQKRFPISAIKYIDSLEDIVDYRGDVIGYNVEIVVTGLKLRELYQFEVAAESSIGVGEFSEPLKNILLGELINKQYPLWPDYLVGIKLFWRLCSLVACFHNYKILKALCHDIRRNCFLMSSLVQKSN